MGNAGGIGFLYRSRKGNGNGITLRKVRWLFVRSPPDQLGFVGYGEGKLAAEIDIADGQSLHQPIVSADFPDGGIKSLRFVSGGYSVIREIAGLRGRMLPSEPISGKSAGGRGEQQGCGQADDFDPFFMTVPPAFLVQCTTTGSWVQVAPGSAAFIDGVGAPW